MPDAKIEIRVGAVSFSGEGPGEWLSKQLDKVLAKLPELASTGGTEPETKPIDAPSGADKPGHRKATLAVYLREKKAATGNQQRKYLATAAWLQDGGPKRIATSDVTKALSNNNQGKLTNPGQCLINLAKAGWVVREGKQFYVTDEGRTELGK